MDSILSKFWDVIAMCVLIVIGMLLHSSFISLLITLLIGLYAFWKPKNALLILVIYLPIRPFITEIESSLKGIADAVIIFSLLRVIFDSRNDWRNIFKLEWFEWALLIYCVLGSISGLLTGVPIVAAVFQSRAFLLFFLLFYIVRRLNVSKEDIRKFVWITVFVAMILSIHGWVEKISIRSWLLPNDWSNMPLSSTNRIRIYGLTDNPNTLGVFLLFSYVCMLYLKNFYSGKVKALINVCIVISLGTIILTFSRGGFLAFIFCSVLYFIVCKNRMPFLKQTVIYVVSAIIFIVLPVIGLTDVMENTHLGETQHKIMSTYDQTEISATDRLTGTFESDQIDKYAQSGRLYYVKKGFNIFLDHPMIGTGFDTFGDSATLSYPSPIYEKYHIGDGIHIFTDNQYIQIIAQTGSIGVILFAIFLLGMLFKIWKERKEQPRLANALLIILLGAYLAGVYYNIWEIDVVDLFFFPMLAVLFPLKNREQKFEF